LTSVYKINNRDTILADVFLLLLKPFWQALV
jgi:hypothetical protein